MRFEPWLMILLWSFCQASAQNTAYFQQALHYEMQLELNDSTHQLSALTSITYKNNSPDTLDFIYFHLWPNAYRNKETDLSQQQVRLGDSEFFFANPSERGGFEKITFKQQEEVLDTLHEGKIDVVKVWLKAPLLPGAQTNIQVDFILQIPESFSRLGHVRQSYQMTQWYPKPAVYDRDGWHPMPYLDIGEYYSEFASFDVKITLPENYWVAATGVLQTPEEAAALLRHALQTQEKLKDTLPSSDLKTQLRKNTIPPSARQHKTIRYYAENVHDFAWFADKRFQVLHDTLQLEEQVVDCWAFFTEVEADLWRQAPLYLKRSTRFYSEQVGAYPYPQVTAVQSPFSKGGGMEYPMITLIGMEYTGRQLDQTITHEVGHNWFFGILGNNEREHAWLDEGLNSFYEGKYMQEFYALPPLWYLPRPVRKGTPIDLEAFSYLQSARRHIDQAPQTHSNGFSWLNYWLGAYEKPALAMNYLEQYYGTALLSGRMQQYFQDWKFKHPSPEQFYEALLVPAPEGQSMVWFRELFETNQQMDYAIARVRVQGDSMEVRLKNEGQLAGPLPIGILTEGQDTLVFWQPGFLGTQTIVLPFRRGEKILLDPQHVTLDGDRTNNAKALPGGGHSPMQLRWLTGLETDGKQTVFWTPVAAANNYDEFMLGLGLHNLGLLNRPFEWGVFPLYSFTSNQLNGVFFGQYSFYPSRDWSRWRLSLEGRRFSSSYNTLNDYYTSFARLVPSLEWITQADPAYPRRQKQSFRAIILREDQPNFSQEGDFIELTGDWRAIYEYAWVWEDRRVVNPFHLEVRLENQQYQGLGGSRDSYLRTAVVWRSSFTYQADRNVDLRLFAGAFIWNTRRKAGAIAPGAFNLTAQGYPGFDDYRYDEFYFGRNENDGWMSQQISIRDAGFKNAISNPFQNQSGNTNDWMVSMNWKADLPEALPFNIPIKPYADFAFVKDSQPLGSDKSIADQLWWSFGLCLDVEDELLAVYFPVLNSENLRNLYAQDGRDSYWTKITFLVDLNRFRPERFRESLLYGPGY